MAAFPARTRSRTFALVRITPVGRMDLETFARAGRVHPDLVHRLYALGLLQATRDATGRLWFAPSDLHELARVQRLHATLPLDYAACGLVTELLDRIAALEATLRHTRRTPDRSEAPEWT